MCRTARGEQVKLPVQILIVAAGCHERLFGFGSSSKAVNLRLAQGRADDDA
jgi:hypothetical protein